MPAIAAAAAPTTVTTVTVTTASTATATTASTVTATTASSTHDTPATTKPATTKPVAARLCCHGTHWRLHMHGPYCLHQQRCWDELVRYCEIGLHELIL